eukprot:COSAG06_NODE_5786_length_3274_cov_1.753071_2_plen_100_part_00
MPTNRLSIDLSKVSECAGYSSAEARHASELEPEPEPELLDEPQPEPEPEPGLPPSPRADAGRYVSWAHQEAIATQRSLESAGVDLLAELGVGADVTRRW